jgi:hypothetical protein
VRQPELPKEVLGFCRSCNAPIYWVEWKGKKHPVDRAVTEDGNLQLFRRADDTVYAEHVAIVDRKGKALRKSHFATCPSAEQHRQRKLL